MFYQSLFFFYCSNTEFFYFYTYTSACASPSPCIKKINFFYYICSSTVKIDIKMVSLTANFIKVELAYLNIQNNLRDL